MDVLKKIVNKLVQKNFDTSFMGNIKKLSKRPLLVLFFIREILTYAFRAMINNSFKENFYEKKKQLIF